MKKLNEAILRVCISADNAISRATGHPEIQKQLGRLSAYTTLFVAGMTITDLAFAGLGTQVTSLLNNDVKPFVQLGVYTAYGVGLGACGNGFWKFAKVTRGDQQESFGGAAGYVGAGGGLIGLARLGDLAADSMSGSSTAGTLRAPS